MPRSKVRVPTTPQLIIRSASGRCWVADLPSGALARLRVYATTYADKQPATTVVALVDAMLTRSDDVPHDAANSGPGIEVLPG